MDKRKLHEHLREAKVDIQDIEALLMLVNAEIYLAGEQMIAVVGMMTTPHSVPAGTPGSRFLRLLSIAMYINTCR